MLESDGNTDVSTSTTTASKTKRLRNQPERYGVRDDIINDDDIFQTIMIGELLENSNVVRTVGDLMNDSNALQTDENIRNDLSGNDDDKENTSSMDVQSSKRQRTNSDVQVETQNQTERDGYSQKSADCFTINTQIALSERISDFQWALLSPGEKILFYKLAEMSKEIKTLQRAVVGIEVNAKHLAEKLEFGLIDDAKLQELGLPLPNETTFLKFEEQLKKSDSFTKVV